MRDLRIASVSAAVNLDDEMSFETDEIDDVNSHRMLAPKTQPASLAAAQGLPESALGCVHRPVEFASAFIGH
jgi:hypothetical protein